MIHIASRLLMSWNANIATWPTITASMYITITTITIILLKHSFFFGFFILLPLLVLRSKIKRNDNAKDR